MDIGKNIRKIREFRDLTQGNLADLLKITQGAYSKIERGDAKLCAEKLIEISKILNVSLDQICYFDEKTFFQKE